MKYDKSKYQFGFSNLYSNEQYNIKSREVKGKKILSVLQDYFNDDLGKMKLCDIGCSTGIQTRILSERFMYTVGVDIDASAIQFANEHLANENFEFLEADSMDLPFDDGTFDVVVCTQVYEHVPNANQLMNEIYRILKTNGVCYFAASNRIQLIEPHYKLPLLSVIPRSLADLYLRIMGKGNRYYERLLTLPSLNNLVSQFEKVDYTKKIISEPQKYNATDMIVPGSFLHKIAIMLMGIMYSVLPSYIWILRKK